MKWIVATSETATHDRKLLRYLGAVLSGATGVLYLLIGLGVLLGGGDSRGRILLAAAVVFFALAAYLAFWRRRSLDLVGAAVQVVCIIGYFAIAPSRTPHFEL